MARKGLTKIQSIPKGIEVLNPLGLGTPVSREKSKLNSATREKVLYSSPNFDPKAFLAQVHKTTSADDLESGAITLKTDLKGRTQQKKQLVKGNFDLKGRTQQKKTVEYADYLSNAARITMREWRPCETR